MTTVIAMLTIIEGREEEYERGVAEWGQKRMSGAPGNQGVQVRRCFEEPSLYSIVSDWDSVEAHKAAMDDPTFFEWVEFARGFYAKPPHVRHFERVS